MFALTEPGLRGLTRRAPGLSSLGTGASLPRVAAWLSRRTRYPPLGALSSTYGSVAAALQIGRSAALWVPKTRATWPDALLAAGHSAPRQAHASPVLACRGVG